MSKYSDALDQLVEELGSILGVPATRDPSLIAGLIGGSGMLFVGFPNIADRTLGGASLDVPVWMIHSNPADLFAADWFLERLDSFINTCQTDTTTAGSFEVGSVTYPSVSATVRVLV